MVVTEARRCRSSLRLAGMVDPSWLRRRCRRASALLLDDLLLVDVLFLERLVLLATREELAVGGLEALLELRDLAAQGLGCVVVEDLRLPDVGQGVAVVAQ